MALPSFLVWGKMLAMIRDWSKERLEAGIGRIRNLIAALDDACLNEDWSGSGLEQQMRALRKYRAALATTLKNMEHVLGEKKPA